MTETTVRRSKVERIKEQSDNLRGRLREELAEPTTHFGEESQQLLKFHGIYQQDNRDERKARKESALEPDYSFMVRTKNPGGYAPAAFYLAIDALADSLGNGTIRATTRQGLQLHGIHKRNLQEVVATISTHLGSTLGACGDINRNVMAPAAPFASLPYVAAREAAVQIAELLTPRTGAYVEVWQGEEKLFTDEPEVEPIYGKTYMPRKFKIAVAVEGDNSVDLYTQDLGLVPLFEGERLVGYNLTVGGGLGMTHANPETFPRRADHLGFVLPEDMLDAVKAIVLVQRDFGDRYNRRHARLKYLIHDRGLEWFRDQVEKYLGKALLPWRPVASWRYEDYLGWHPQGDGRYFLGLWIENGRILDREGLYLKSALRQIVERFGLHLIFTPTQNLLIVDVLPDQREAIDGILQRAGIETADNIVPSHRYAMACPALPTCSLALTESERVLPSIVEELTAHLRQLELADTPISIRMTGCPNGCARPYMGEIGFVGSAPGAYHLFLGGNFESTRLNWLFRERVKREEIAALLAPLFAYFKDERLPGESFGDFCARKGKADLEAQLL